MSPLFSGNIAKVCVKKGSKFFRRTVTRNGTNYNSGNKVNRNWRTLKRCPLVLIDFFYMKVKDNLIFISSGTFLLRGARQNTRQDHESASDECISAGPRLHPVLPRAAAGYNDTPA